MARRKCPKCNTSNSDDALFCRHCGEKLFSQNQQSTSNVSNNEEGCFMIGLNIFGGFVSFVLILGGIVCAFNGLLEGLWLSVIGIIIAAILGRNE